MRPVLSTDLVDDQTSEEIRPAFRQEAMAAKAARRVHACPHLTFLFENTLTIRYQIQEMMRAERIVRERDIQHELGTYNALLGGPGELGCTLLIEIDDPLVRAVRLTEWYDLAEHLYVVIPIGVTIRATFDESQRGDGRLSSVQYLKFPVKGVPPVAVGVDHAQLRAETALTLEQVDALATDLA